LIEYNIPTMKGKTMTNQLRIVENDITLFPNMFKAYEVFDISNKDILDPPPLFGSDTLQDAVSFCYNLGYNFEVGLLVNERKAIAELFEMGE